MEIYWELLIEAGLKILPNELDIGFKKIEDLKIKLDKTWYQADYVTDYKQEHAGGGYQFKKIHRYCRIVRFRNNFYHLLGFKGRVGKGDLNEIIWKIGRKVRSSPTRSYNVVYKFLKLKKWRKYYISIPYIIKIITGKQWNFKNKYFTSIYEICTFIEKQFSNLSYIFNLKSTDLNRKRFPKLQYIALRLLEDIEIFPPFHIPTARTIKKRKTLNPIYLKMHDMIFDLIYSEF